jgi:hypothetical protein
LSPKAREQDYARRKEWLKGFHALDSGAAGETESKIIDKQLEQYARESYLRDARRMRMSEAELQYDMRLEQALDDARAQERAGGA